MFGSKKISRTKKVVGLVERVTIIGRSKVSANALMDTGARQTSVDAKIAEASGLGPALGTISMWKVDMRDRVKRPAVEGTVVLRGRRFRVKMNVADRSKMFTPVLVGRDILFSNFVVDVEKTHHSPKVSRLRSENGWAKTENGGVEAENMHNRAREDNLYRDTPDKRGKKAV